MLERLLVVETCVSCKNAAFWAWCQQPMCYSHLRGMAEMNSDNEAAVYQALVFPVVTFPKSDEVLLLIYPTTCVSAVCSVLNQVSSYQLSHRYNGTILINAIEERHWHDGTRLECVGRCSYRLSSTTIGCHAPMIKPVGLETGRMVGFAHGLNEYSRKIRTYVEQEFREGEGVEDGIN
jgi:hypothetical protein